MRILSGAVPVMSGDLSFAAGDDGIKRVNRQGRPDHAEGYLVGEGEGFVIEEHRKHKMSAWGDILEEPKRRQA